MHTDGQVDRWWQVQRQRIPQKAPTRGHHSPDLTDILLSHLHVDDNGVDLAVHQLPHSPCTQLQQAVLLFRQTDRQTVYSWAHPSLLHPPLPTPLRGQSCFISKEPKETGDADSCVCWETVRSLRTSDSTLIPTSHPPAAPANKQNNGSSGITMFR